MSINKHDEQAKFAKELLSIEEKSCGNEKHREIVESLANIAGLAFGWAGDGDSDTLYNLMEYFDCRLEAIDGNNANSGWLKKDKAELDRAINELNDNTTIS